MIMNKIAERIKRQMEIVGIKQEKLEKKAHVGQSTVNRILNTKNRARIDTLSRIAAVLDVPLEYLTTDNDVKAALFLAIHQMDQDEVNNTISHVEKERLWKERSTLSDSPRQGLPIGERKKAS
jgi:transcriptional regulator with XRE-family HTH domain